MEGKKAQIVISTNGFWVGKELYEGERYISFDPIRKFLPIEDVRTVTIETIISDIEQNLKIKTTQETPDSVIRDLAQKLCSEKFGMLYCFDYRAPFGVRKIFNPPTFE